MIICQVIKKHFDKVVQNILNPVSFASGVFLCVFLLSACNNWPDPAERVLAVTHRQADIPGQVDHEYIASFVNISKARLDFLVSSGAQFCLPGQVSLVNKHLLRAKQEVDGNLLLDAQYSLAKAMDHLDKSSQIMMGLASGSECLEAFRHQNDDADKVAAYVDSLNRLLNCQCDQLTNEKSLVESFSKRLEIVAKSLSAHEQMQLNIYVDSEVNQAQEVLMFLSNVGVREKQINILYETVDNVQLSDDGLLFEIFVIDGKKYYKVKDWQQDLKFKVLQKEQSYGM